MSITTKHYFKGNKLFFPFSEFGDHQTGFLERVYIIDQDAFQAQKNPFNKPLDETSYNEFRRSFEKRPRLLDVVPEPEPPGRFRVKEIYGYIPSAVHVVETNSVSWTRPAISLPGIDSNLNVTDISRIGSPRSVVLTAVDTSNYVLGDLILFRAFISYTKLVTGAFERDTSSVSFRGEVTAITPTTITVQAEENGSVRSRLSGNTLIAIRAGIWSDAVMDQFFRARENSVGSFRLVERMNLYKLETSNRSAKSVSVPSVKIRSYFGFDSVDSVRMPTPIEPWSAKTASGADTFILTTTTIPSASDYTQLIGTPINATEESFGKLYPLLYYRESDHINLF